MAAMALPWAISTAMGYDEIYVCQPGGLPNRLYRVNADASFEDITESWGAGLLDDTSAALFLDLRNTGRQDLVVLRSSGPILLLNEGKRFRLRTDAFRFANLPAGGFTGMAAADFDRDGKLDLYLCCYVYFQSEAQYTYASPYHDAQNGPPELSVPQSVECGWVAASWTTAPRRPGMNENNNRFSFAPAWCDFNDDGWPDLYVANDFGRKNLYRNRERPLSRCRSRSGRRRYRSGDERVVVRLRRRWTARISTSRTCGLPPGSASSADPNFTPGVAENGSRGLPRPHHGQLAVPESRRRHLRRRDRRQHVAFGRWAWSSGGHDFDNDGHPEIFVTCGMLTNRSDNPISDSFFWRQVVAHSPVTATPSAEYENGWNAINQFIREDYSWNGREPNVLHARRGDRYFDFSGRERARFRR